VNELRDKIASLRERLLWDDRYIIVAGLVLLALIAGGIVLRAVLNKTARGGDFGITKEEIASAYVPLRPSIEKRSPVKDSGAARTVNVEGVYRKDTNSVSFGKATYGDAIFRYTDSSIVAQPSYDPSDVVTDISLYNGPAPNSSGSEGVYAVPGPGRIVISYPSGKVDVDVAQTIARKILIDPDLKLKKEGDGEYRLESNYIVSSPWRVVGGNKLVGTNLFLRKYCQKKDSGFSPYNSLPIPCSSK